MPGYAATKGSMHTCPMFNPGLIPPPHTGGPVIGPGVHNVFIGGKPAAVMGDICTCAGPSDAIIMGEGTVFIGGKPAATVGCSTAHGGVITVGEPTVIIGTGPGAKTVVAPLHDIPFPAIGPVLRVMSVITGNGSALQEAQVAQDAIREMSENEYGYLNDFGLSL